MQENKHTQFQELSNKFSFAMKMIPPIHAEEIDIMYQIIGLLGYKYLSENVKNNTEDMGYELNENLCYEKLLIDKDSAIDIFKEGIKQITEDNDNIQSADVFYDLFNFVDFKTFSDNDTWLSLINVVEELCSQTTATIGEIIMFLTKYGHDNGACGSIKSTDEIIKLITTNQKDVKNIYDSFVDDVTLLAEVGKIINVENYYGQHPNVKRCALAKITLLTNDVNYKNIFIKCNSISEPINWNVKFDLAVTIPPFSSKLMLNKDDDRFKPYLPKRTEFAYVLDMLYNLDENGTIKIIVANGSLFSSPDKKLIKYFVDNGLLSSIIGLPGGLLEITAIPTALLTINKKSVNDEIYYLNLRNTQTKRLNRKNISIEDIDKYIEILHKKEKRELISAIATIDEIRENNYNLAINRYVDLEKLETIDVDKTVYNIKKIKTELKQVDEKITRKLTILFKK